MNDKKLKSCVEALKEVRRSMQDDADSCILAALDEVISKLERCAAENDPTVAEAVREALAVLGDILTCAGFAVELVKILGA
jgi:cell division septum initiation protein DivIVA